MILLHNNCKDYLNRNCTLLSYGISISPNVLRVLRKLISPFRFRCCMDHHHVISYKKNLLHTFGAGIVGNCQSTELYSYTAVVASRYYFSISSFECTKVFFFPNKIVFNAPFNFNCNIQSGPVWADFTKLRRI